MSDYTHPHPGDKVVLPSPATAYYYPEEGAFDEEATALSDEDHDKETKDKKKKEKKKKKKKEDRHSSTKESKRSSSERLSSRRSEETLAYLKRSSSERPSSERKEHRRREVDQMLATRDELRVGTENEECRRGRRERMSKSGSINQPREDEYLANYEPRLIPDMHTEQRKRVTFAQEQREKNRSRRPDMDVPKIIEVKMNSARSLGPGSVIPEQQTSRSSTKSDYERFLQMLGEESELPPLNPLIMSSDQDFQEAFDALAQDSVFDDNFEKAFNEFSEHYLALSPWGEDDPMNSCGKGDKSIKNQPTFNEADFIQIPLTPVLRRGLMSDIPSNLNHGSSSKKKDKLPERPRTPTVQQGHLDDNAFEKLEKKEVHGGDEFVEISRTPYHRRNKVILEDDSNGNGKCNAGHSSMPHHFQESSPAPTDKEKKRHKNWNILPLRRSTSAAKF